MFLDVTLYGEEIVDHAQEILEAWREEHEGYYGRPHGQTPISRQYGGFGFDTLPPSGGLWLTSGLNYHALQILQEDGVECVRLTYSGRRHGMRAEFARFLETYWDTSVEVSPCDRRERRLHAYVTQEPDWLPWETLDDHEEADAVKALSLDEYYTTYASGYGRREAIQLPWDVVEAILGHPHEGSAEDDARLIEALVRSGAPGWVRDADGWIDERGWGLIGPRIEEVDADA